MKICKLNKCLLDVYFNVSMYMYCKCITFGEVFFLAPLAVVSLRQIKYIAKYAFIKV